MRKNRGTAYGVIGLGRFGTALAIALAQAGKEVIAIDRSEEKIKKHTPLYGLCICCRES